MKNVLAVHDISCIGRCSLTVALPIVSAFGSTCASLPTALLSTHTGGFTGFTCLDLTDEMRKIMQAWKPLGLKFDAVYSGFLACAEQVDIVKEILKSYKSGKTIAVIDPVMADDGKLYKIFDASFVEKMRELLPYAEVLIPNMTEAMLLAGVPYIDGPYTPEFIASLIAKLQKLGAKNVVLTGVFYKQSELGAAVSEKDGEVETYFSRKIEGSYHGTGDIFGSVLTAELMNGKTLLEAVASAVNFVVDAINATDKNADKKYGVNFETVLYKKSRT